MPPLANGLQQIIQRLDKYQRAHSRLAFLVGLVKKISEDEAGQRAALLTYYGFLSLFPLLLVATTLLKLFLRRDQAVDNQVIAGITKYVPVIGNELQQNVHGLGSSGVALVVGLVLALYGARGVADVLRDTIDRIWEVPHKDRIGFPNNLFRSISLIIVGGIGLIAAPVISSYALLFGHTFFFRLLSILLTVILLFGVLIILLKLGSSQARPFRTIWAGTAIAAVGLGILQLLGNLIVTHQLKHLNNLYGTFAIVLGLFYWMYLQAQVMVYGFEFDTVRVLRLWPRSLQGVPTVTDEEANRLYATRAQFPEGSNRV